VRAELAVTYFHLAGIYQALNQTEESIEALRKGLDLVDALLREQPPDDKLRQKLAGFWKGFRMLDYREGPPLRDPEAALGSLRKAAELWGRFAQEHPAVPGFRSDLAAVVLQMSRLQADLGRAEEALRLNHQARSHWEKLTRENPQAHAYRADLAESYHYLGV